MTITINLTEQDVAQASKSLIGLIQSCAESRLRRRIPSPTKRPSTMQSSAKH